MTFHLTHQALLAHNPLINLPYVIDGPVCIARLLLLPPPHP